MATIRKRGDNYFIDYRVNGRRVRKSVGSSKKAAEQALQEIEQKVVKGKVTFDAIETTIQNLFREFYSYCRASLSPNTQNRYSAIIKNFSRFLEQTFPELSKVSHLTARTFSEYKSFRLEEGAAKATINGELIVLRMLMKLAMQWGYLNYNPTDEVSKLKEDKREVPRYLTEEEIQKLLDACDDWLYPIFYTFLHTGLRKTELEQLEWDDIDLEERVIHITAKDRWTPKKNERDIPISDGLFEVLTKQKQLTGDGDLVFVDEQGQAIHKNRLRKKLIALTKRIGLSDVTQIFTLRHTFASHLILSGVDIQTLKELMGHADAKTTMIYTHLAQDLKQKAIEKLDKKKF